MAHSLAQSIAPDLTLRERLASVFGRRAHKEAAHHPSERSGRPQARQELPRVIP